MKDFVHAERDEAGTAVRLWLRLEPAKTQELHTLLSQALNTRPDAPKWLFGLCDMTDPNPVPAPTNARSKA